MSAGLFKNYDDADERRVLKMAGGATEVFHYGRNGRLITENADCGTILGKYAWLNDAPVALPKYCSVRQHLRFQERASI